MTNVLPRNGFLFAFHSPSFMLSSFLSYRRRLCPKVYLERNYGPFAVNTLVKIC